MGRSTFWALGMLVYLTLMLTVTGCSANGNVEGAGKVDEVDSVGAQSPTLDMSKVGYTCMSPLLPIVDTITGSAGAAQPNATILIVNSKTTFTFTANADGSFALNSSNCSLIDTIRLGCNLLFYQTVDGCSQSPSTLMMILP